LSEFSLCGCAKIACTVCSCFRYSIISEGATHLLGRNNSSLGILALENYKSDIIKYAGKWLLEEFDGLYDPYSGIPNNLSESYNAVMKQENDWKELPDDMLVLGFHYLQNFCTVLSEFSLCGCAKIACTVCSCFRYSIISEGATHF
jgi:hypothetical protein